MNILTTLKSHSTALIPLTFIGVLTGCSSYSVDDYAERSPQLDPREFFDGKICADGVVRDRSGKQIRQFNAEILASWNEEGVGTLDEIFQFDDGRETRQWTLTPVKRAGSQRVDYYQAQASDVPIPTQMKFAGNSIHMAYELNYVTGKDDQGKPETISLNMNDWMYQVSEGVVINETEMTKFGLHVGQVLLVMTKVDNSIDCLSTQR